MKTPTAPIEVAGYWLVPADAPDRLHCQVCYREIAIDKKQRTQDGFNRAAKEHRARWHFQVGDEFGCTVEASGICRCLDAAPTVSELVPVMRQGLSLERLEFARHLWLTNRIAEWNQPRRPA